MKKLGGCLGVVLLVLGGIAIRNLLNPEGTVEWMLHHGGIVHRDGYTSAVEALLKPEGPDVVGAESALGSVGMLPADYGISISADQRAGLLRLTASPSAPLRCMAAVVLVHAGGLDPARVALVLGPPSKHFLASIYVKNLARYGPLDRATLELVAARASERDRWVQIAAIEGLARFLLVDRERVRAVWRTLTHDPDERVRDSAAFQLSPPPR